MPRLLVFAPCQKAIVDKTDNLISLISVMHGLTISLPEGQEPMPENAVAAINWGIGTVWLQLPGDEEKTFEQRVDIVKPSGTRVETDPYSFQVKKRSHQVAMHSNSFPIGERGEYRLILMFREVGKDSDWEQIAEYPIEIKITEIKEQKAG